MKKVVFYSWQSDLPNGTNRTLVENALKDAAKEIGEDSSDIEPVIDRDTQGVPGAPNIATAIFDKIKSADIFVADVSIIGTAKKRPVPNPNVLIELGYALHALGHERIVLVFNTAYGKVEKLPFDLRMHKAITYNCGDSITDRSTIKKELTKDFKAALLSGFSHVSSKKKASTDIIDVIKTNLPSKKIELRNHLTGILSELEQLEPKMKQDGGTVEDLLSAIPKTDGIIVEFSKLVETVVLMNDMDSTKEIFQWFGKILTKYDPVVNTGGQIWNCNGDFYKVIGHELFVVFITPFLREEKWSEVKEILNGTLHVGPTEHNRNGRKTDWTELSAFSPLIADEGKTRRRISPHGDILKERYEKEPIASIIPFKEFTEIDFFLHLYGEGITHDRFSWKWYPRSDIWLHHTPKFIYDAVDYPTAMKICNALKIVDVDELKRRLSRLTIQWDWRSPVDDQDINKIGSKGGAQIIYPS